VFMRRIKEWEHALGRDKWPNYVLNNHDTVRSATRYGQGEDDARMKVLAAMLLTLRGTPFLYYGEEIGMRDIRVRRRDILDPIGKRYWPIYVGRDGCRAPMQWDASPQAGFTDGEPWLPIHPNYEIRNVARQSKHEGSLLHFYKKMLTFRRSQPALVKGDFLPLDAGNRSVMAYQRQYIGQKLLVLLNFSAARKNAALPAGAQFSPAFSSHSHSPDMLLAGRIQLEGNEALILHEK